MKDEAYYRGRAQEARKLADQLSDDDELKAGWLRIADGYDSLVKNARAFQARHNSKAKDSSRA